MFLMALLSSCLSSGSGGAHCGSFLKVRLDSEEARSLALEADYLLLRVSCIQY